MCDKNTCRDCRKSIKDDPTIWAWNREVWIHGEIKTEATYRCYPCYRILSQKNYISHDVFGRSFLGLNCKDSALVNTKYEGRC